MSEMNFEDYAKSIVDSSSILPDDAIMGFVAMRKVQPVMLYAYRIAAYAAQDVRTSGRAPTVCDDTDYIDAVQECIPHVPQMVQAWSKNPKHKFASYVNAACKIIVLNYLWEQAKGGTDYATGKGPTVEQWPETDQHSTDTMNDDFYIEDGAGWDADLPYPFAPQGFRDPMEELIAAEDEDRALRALMQPDISPEATRQRNSRVWRTLRIKGAQHHD
jgi:hypothetical protein